jgi:hypothetical protein
MEIIYAFDDGPDGTTTVSVRVQGSPGAMYRLAGQLMARPVRHSVGNDFRTLSRLIERDRGRLMYRHRRARRP